MVKKKLAALILVPLPFFYLLFLAVRFGIHSTDFEPSVENLVGTYSMRDWDTKGTSSRQPRIVLKKDGWCLLDVPQCWKSGGECDRLTQFRAKWSLVDDDQTGWTLLIRELLKQGEESHHITLLTQESRPTLALEYDAPDTGDTFLFEKNG